MVATCRHTLHRAPRSLHPCIPCTPIPASAERRTTHHTPETSPPAAVCAFFRGWFYQITCDRGVVASRASSQVAGGGGKGEQSAEREECQQR